MSELRACNPKHFRFRMSKNLLNILRINIFPQMIAIPPGRVVRLTLSLFGPHVYIVLTCTLPRTLGGALRGAAPFMCALPFNSIF